jgi:hypothetical protein
VSAAPYREPSALAAPREPRAFERTPSELVVGAVNALALLAFVVLPYLHMLGLTLAVPSALAVLGIALPGRRRRRVLLLPSIALWSAAGLLGLGMGFLSILLSNGNFEWPGAAVFLVYGAACLGFAAFTTRMYRAQWKGLPPVRPWAARVAAALHSGHG